MAKEKSKSTISFTLDNALIKSLEELRAARSINLSRFVNSLIIRALGGLKKNEK